MTLMLVWWSPKSLNSRVFVLLMSTNTYFGAMKVIDVMKTVTKKYKRTTLNRLNMLIMN